LSLSLAYIFKTSKDSTWHNIARSNITIDGEENRRERAKSR